MEKQKQDPHISPIMSLLLPLIPLHCAFRFCYLQEQLRVEKQNQDARMAAYLLAADHGKPGMFYLGFIASTNPHREYFTVTPDAGGGPPRARGRRGR